MPFVVDAGEHYVLDQSLLRRFLELFLCALCKVGTLGSGVSKLPSVLSLLEHEGIVAALRERLALNKVRLELEVLALESLDLFLRARSATRGAAMRGCTGHQYKRSWYDLSVRPGHSIRV